MEDKAYLLGHNMCLCTNGNTTNPFKEGTELYDSWRDGYNYGLTFINL